MVEIQIEKVTMVTQMHEEEGNLSTSHSEMDWKQHFQSKNVGGSLIVYEGRETPNTASPGKFGIILLPGLLKVCPNV